MILLFSSCLFIWVFLSRAAQKCQQPYGWVAFWMLELGPVYAWWMGNDVVVRNFIVFTLAGLAFFIDLKNRYFGPCWLWGLLAVVVLGFFEPVDLYSRLLALSYGLLGLWWWSRQKMGSADAAALLGLGWFMGIERLSVTVWMACLLGIGYRLFFKERLLPFMSFLSWAIVPALVHGYWLWEWFSRAELWLVD